MKVEEVGREVALSILKKLKLTYAENIPVERARKKLERVLAKEDVSGVKFSKDERAAVEALTGKKAPADESGEELEAEESAPPAPPPQAPTGMVPFMRKLLAKGRSDAKVVKVVSRKYREAGFTDEDVIKRRVEVTLTLAKSEEGGDVAKKSKKSKPEAAEEEPKKKSKKVKEAETPAEEPKKPKKKDTAPSAGKVDEATPKKGKKKKAKAKSDEEE